MHACTHVHTHTQPEMVANENTLYSDQGARSQWESTSTLYWFPESQLITANNYIIHNYHTPQQGIGRGQHITTVCRHSKQLQAKHTHTLGQRGLGPSVLCVWSTNTSCHYNHCSIVSFGSLSGWPKGLYYCWLVVFECWRVPVLCVKVTGKCDIM